MTSPEQPPSAQWSDDPRDPADADDLGRGAFVETVGRRMELATLADSSTVFGLVGQWGSGKSSVIARIREKLSDDWVIGDFTPWATGDSAAMSLEFVSTIATVLGAKTAGETRQKLAQYAAFVSPMLAAIPFLGDGVKGTADGILNALGSRPPWHEQFEGLSEDIQTAGKRVLIVVDDVDRLGGDELLTLLRVVRLLGRFRGVHYLIAYDQQTVEDLLASAGAAGRSAAFMEKIVQYPFEMPPISPAASIRLVNDAIRQLLDETGLQMSESGLERIAELVGVIAPQVETPRTLGRFAEQLTTFAQHVIDAELDLPDYVAVTWLRLAAHDVWVQLPKWRAELASGERYEALTVSKPIAAEEWEERVAKTNAGIDAGSIVRVLSFLFPGVDSRGLTYNMPHERALSDQTYFSRYMLLALPEDDVSDELVREVLVALESEVATSRADELEQILDGTADRANLAFSRITRLRRDATETSAKLLEFLSRRFDARKEDAPDVGAPRNILMNWIAREMALGLLAGEFSALDVIGWFGEEESFVLARQASRMNEFRADKKRLTDGFAAYWLGRLDAEPEVFLADMPRLRGVADIVVFSRGDDAKGMLDFAAAELQSYMKLATSFVRFEEWVGSGVHYSMAFRDKLFSTAVSQGVRDKYRGELAVNRPDVDYQVEDLPKPEASAEEIDAFVVDSLLALE